MSPPAQNARPPGPSYDDPSDILVDFPFVERAGDRAQHGQRQRVERLRAVEHDEAGAAAPLDKRLGVLRRVCHTAATSERTASIALATRSIGAMPSTRCNSPRSR